MDGTVFRFILLPNRDVKTIYKYEWIEGPELTILLPSFSFLQHTVGDIGNAFRWQAESVNIFNGRGYVMLAHTSAIYGEYFILDTRNILWTLRNSLGLKGALSVTRDTNRNLAEAASDCLIDIAVAAVVCILAAMVIRRVAQLIIHLTLQHSL